MALRDERAGAEETGSSMGSSESVESFKAEQSLQQMQQRRPSFEMEEHKTNEESKGQSARRWRWMPIHRPAAVPARNSA